MSLPLRQSFGQSSVFQELTFHYLYFVHIIILEFTFDEIRIGQSICLLEPQLFWNFLKHLLFEASFICLLISGFAKDLFSFICDPMFGLGVFGIFVQSFEFYSNSSSYGSSFISFSLCFSLDELRILRLFLFIFTRLSIISSSYWWSKNRFVLTFWQDALLGFRIYYVLADPGKGGEHQSFNHLLPAGRANKRQKPCPAYNSLLQVFPWGTVFPVPGRTRLKRGRRYPRHSKVKNLARITFHGFTASRRKRNTNNGWLKRNP